MVVDRVMLQRAELIALDKTASLSIAEASASIGRVALAIPSAILRSWAIPLGYLVGGLLRWISFSRLSENGVTRVYMSLVKTPREPHAVISSKTTDPWQSRTWG